MREKPRYTIVVPTMWKFKPFLNFLDTLLNYDLVGEVILINNNVGATPREVDDIDNPKLRRLDQETNIGVNPAWNLGTYSSNFPFVCILNDDVIFDLSVLAKLVPFLSDPNTGIMGLSPGEPDFNQTKITTGGIDIVKWNGQHTFGFGCLMFINRKNYIKIPEDMIYYYGDNFLFDTCLANRKTNYIIENIVHFTPYAQTVGDTGKGHLEPEQQRYDEHIKNNRWALDIFNNEYQRAVEADTDIKDHIPTLHRYAYDCKSVLELGVRTGVSTRAFLNANLEHLTSIDLEEEYFVRDLFNVADIVHRDYRYIIADTRTYEVDRRYDMVFIDTDHRYEQLKAELGKYHKFIDKYIIMHDTFKDGIKQEEDDKGLLRAIFEFLIENPEWQIKEHSTESNGLIVLKRREN